MQSGRSLASRGVRWAIIIPTALCAALLAGHLGVHTGHPAARLVQSRYVRLERGLPVVVALGDSITYGWPLRQGRRHPWTAILALRLGSPVVNAGIPGNAVGLTRCRRCGAPGVARLAGALAIPGVRTLIVMEGINDILHGGSASEIIAALTQIADRSHRRGVRVIGGTLLPFGTYRGHSAAREAMRRRVNAWIRTSGLFDGVVDFDALLRDPRAPLRLKPAYDCGDGLHPNTLGYRMMGEAIPLALVRSADCPRCRGDGTAAAHGSHPIWRPPAARSAAGAPLRLPDGD